MVTNSAPLRGLPQKAHSVLRGFEAQHAKGKSECDDSAPAKTPEYCTMALSMQKVQALAATTLHGRNDTQRRQGTFSLDGYGMTARLENNDSGLHHCNAC